MRLVSFQDGARAASGIRLGEDVVDLAALDTTLAAVLAADAEARKQLAAARPRHGPASTNRFVCTARRSVEHGRKFDASPSRSMRDPFRPSRSTSKKLDVRTRLSFRTKTLRSSMSMFSTPTDASSRAQRMADQRARLRCVRRSPSMARFSFART